MNKYEEMLSELIGRAEEDGYVLTIVDGHVKFVEEEK